MSPTVKAICYVDFGGDLIATACQRSVDVNYTNTTIYMSSATCPECQAAIQGKLALLLEQQRALPSLADAVSLRDADSLRL